MLSLKQKIAEIKSLATRYEGYITVFFTGGIARNAIRAKLGLALEPVRDVDVEVIFNNTDGDLYQKVDYMFYNLNVDYRAYDSSETSAEDLLHSRDFHHNEVILNAASDEAIYTENCVNSFIAGVVRVSSYALFNDLDNRSGRINARAALFAARFHWNVDNIPYNDEEDPYFQLSISCCKAAALGYEVLIDFTEKLEDTFNESIYREMRSGKTLQILKDNLYKVSKTVKRNVLRLDMEDRIKIKYDWLEDYMYNNDIHSLRCIG